MFVIGIEGKTGSGKTTTCEYFRDKHHIHTINVDNLMKENGIWGDFDNLVFSLQQGKSVHYTRNVSGKEGIRSKKTSLEIKAAIRVAILAGKINKLIEKQLEDCQAQGREYVIVDFAKLDAMKCWRKMDARILVESDDKRRRKGLQQREGEGFEEWMRKFDSFLEYRWLRYDERSITHRIKNDGSLEELHQQIDGIVAEIKMQKRKKDFRREIRSQGGCLGKLSHGIGKLVRGDWGR